MRRGIYFFFASLWPVTAVPAHADGYNVRPQCVAGAFRSCASGEIEFTHGIGAQNERVPVLLVHASKLIGHEPATHVVMLRGRLSFASKLATPSPNPMIVASGKPTGRYCKMGADCALVTPEPATTILMATGLVGLAGWSALRRRRQTRSGAKTPAT